jgi:3-oxoacid CoA-transferase subunit A
MEGDTSGNLVYKETARNFNPVMAMAGKMTIAEVEHLVPAGELDPNNIHTRAFMYTASLKELIMRKE